MIPPRQQHVRVQVEAHRRICLAHAEHNEGAACTRFADMQVAADAPIFEGFTP